MKVMGFQSSEACAEKQLADSRMNACYPDVASRTTEADPDGRDRGLRMGEAVGRGVGNAERGQAFGLCNRVAQCNPVAHGGRVRG